MYIYVTMINMQIITNNILIINNKTLNYISSPKSLLEQNIMSGTLICECQ